MKISINSTLDFSKIGTAYKTIDNTPSPQADVLTFVKINDLYVIASDGCVYQFTYELPPVVILAYEVEGDDSAFLNYAEDEVDWGAVKEFVESLTPSFQELRESDMTSFKDDYELTAKCAAYDSDDVVTSNISLVNMFESECEYFADYSQFYYFCGMRKSFNDFGTRFNQFDNSPDYTPHTVYYFF